MTPNDRWHRRAWNYGNRPYRGCGCLWMLLAGLLLSFVVSALLPNTTAICLPFVF